MNINQLWRLIRDKIYSKLFPIKYLRKIGVNIKGKVYIYGTVTWSTEPWLITLGDNVYITNGCKFVTHDGGTLLFRNIVPDLEITQPITIGNNVYIGVNSIILPGVNIGNNVIIGAGSIVTRCIPDNSVAVGVPAKVIESINTYLEKAQKKSLHLGHLKGKEKDNALKKYYGYNKKNSIY